MPNEDSSSINLTSTEDDTIKNVSHFSALGARS